MVGWLIFAACLAVVGSGLTLLWWRVGDQWADEEHKRFRTGQGEGSRGAQVVRGFGSSQEEPDDGHP
ncbi:MAG: hypothetical protein DYG94_02885 [Leptolyngbya sp. PLA3]|nr:MAG: hypothetical protein EDM82_11415 [Cyanobacteria bacterium CYA]MCE7967674.1 hypothetical protein [Leptolyngbya sp. PL-A3]